MNSYKVSETVEEKKLHQRTAISGSRYIFLATILFYVANVATSSSESSLLLSVEFKEI